MHCVKIWFKFAVQSNPTFVNFQTWFYPKQKNEQNVSHNVFISEAVPIRNACFSQVASEYGANVHAPRAHEPSADDATRGGQRRIGGK